MAEARRTSIALTPLWYRQLAGDLDGDPTITYAARERALDAVRREAWE